MPESSTATVAGGGRPDEQVSPGQAESAEFAEVFAQFACPQAAPDEDLFATVVGDYAQAWTARFLEEFRGQLTSRGRGLGELVRGWLEATPPWETLWDSTQGLVRRAVLVPCDPLPAAAQLGLSLVAGGHAGDFGIRLHSPQRFRAGRWLLPRAVAFTAQPQEGQGEGEGGVRLRLEPPDGGSVLELEWRDGSWSGPGLLELPRVRRGEFDAFQWTAEAGDAYMAAIEPYDPSSTSHAEIGALCLEALELLETHAPSYARWVSRVVREIAPIHAAEGELRSYNGDDEHPGRVSFSVPAQPAAVAEMLVHESSHLHLAIARRLGDVVNGLDNETYFSPIRGTERPIERVLYAYHAFGNVALFYRRCIESGIQDGGYCERNLERHRPELETLREGLGRTRGLTELGRVLWRSVEEQLER